MSPWFIIEACCQSTKIPSEFFGKGDDIIKPMQDPMQDNCKWLHNAVFELKRANKVKLDLQCPCAINQASYFINLKE